MVDRAEYGAGRKKYTFIARSGGYYWWTTTPDHLDDDTMLFSIEVTKFWVRTPPMLLLEEAHHAYLRIRGMDEPA